MASAAALRATRPTFTELFTPKLVTLLRAGYGWADFRADAIAGLTVAIVALPLSMAIAIGSGLSPDKGLYTAVVGGFLVSALGGSRFQIGGPAGAFIVLIASIVERQGYDGLVLATLLLVSLPAAATDGTTQAQGCAQVDQLLWLLTGVGILLGRRATHRRRRWGADQPRPWFATVGTSTPPEAWSARASGCAR